MSNYYDYGPNYDDLLSTRKYPNSYTPQVIKNVEMLSFSDEGAVPFGSYIYKVQKYPGDIDLVEVFEECCTIKDIVNKMAKKFQSIVRKIVKERKHYMIEAKIGEDDRYDVGPRQIGYIDKGIYYFHDSQKKKLEELTEEMIYEGLIDEDEYDIIHNILSKQNNSTNDYDILYNLFRNHRVIRWSDKEILQGWKMLPGNIKITLKKALSHEGHVKIDMITDINNRFTEMTNFLFLVEKKVDGKKYVINLASNLTDDLLTKRIERELPKEIEKLFYSAYYYNPFKGIKRLWALARHYKDFDMIKKLKPFISGNISLLYQLKSEIENIIVLVKKLKTFPKVTINNQIEDIKSRIVYVLEIADEDEYLFELFNKAYEEKDKEAKIEILDKIKKTLVSYINYFTLEYLDHVGIYTIPYPYVPKDSQYNTRHILPPTTKKVAGSGFDNDMTGGSCWTDFLRSRRFKDVYEDFLDYNNCKRKTKNTYVPKKNNKKIKVPEELVEKEEIFNIPTPPPPMPFEQPSIPKLSEQEKIEIQERRQKNKEQPKNIPEVERKIPPREAMMNELLSKIKDRNKGGGLSKRQMLIKRLRY